MNVVDDAKDSLKGSIFKIKHNYEIILLFRYRFVNFTESATLEASFEHGDWCSDKNVIPLRERNRLLRVDNIDWKDQWSESV